jgi:APA family basic amino acid/polyamine antiporter
MDVFISIAHQKKILAILVIVGFTLIHLRGLKLGSLIQNSFTIYKVLLMVAVIALGFLLGRGDWSHFLPVSDSFIPPNVNWKSIALSLMWIMFAYSGWNASAYIGSEIKNPVKNLSGSLIIGTIVVIIIYLLLNALYIFAIAPVEMGGVISIGGLTVKNLFGEVMEKVFSVLFAFALLSSISAFIIIGPRVYYAMSKDGYFFRFASRIHPKYNVPHWSIIFQAVISCFIILTGTLDQIFTYMGFALGIFPLFVVVGLFKLRMSKSTVLKIPGYPISAIIFLFFGISILILSLLERPFESAMAIGTILVGIPFYYLFKWGKGQR